MIAIRQRKGFESRAYTFDPETEFVEVELKTVREKFRYKVHISEVGNEIQYQSDNVLLAKLFFGLSAFIAVFFIGLLFLW